MSYEKAANGDLDSQNKLIEKYQGRVTAIVKKYLSQKSSYGYLKDDLIAAGSLALVQLVRDLTCSKMPEDKFESRLDSHLRCSIRLAIELEQTIRVPHTSGRRHPDRRPQVTNMNMDVFTVEPELDDPLEDLNDVEAYYATLKMHGFTDKEAAKRLRVSASTIKRLKRKLCTHTYPTQGSRAGSQTLPNTISDT